MKAKGKKKDILLKRVGDFAREKLFSPELEPKAVMTLYFGSELDDAEWERKGFKVCLELQTENGWEAKGTITSSKLGDAPNCRIAIYEGAKKE